MEWTFLLLLKVFDCQKNHRTVLLHDLYQGYSRFLLVMAVVTINFVNVIDLLMNDGRGNHNELVHMFYSSGVQAERVNWKIIFIHLRALVTQVSGGKERMGTSRITSVVFLWNRRAKKLQPVHKSDRRLIRKRSNIPCPKRSDRCDSSNDMVGIYRFEVWS